MRGYRVADDDAARRIDLVPKRALVRISAQRLEARLWSQANDTWPEPLVGPRQVTLLGHHLTESDRLVTPSWAGFVES